MLRPAALIAAGAFCLLAEERPTNWNGAYEPCENRSQLLRYDHMELGVRISTSNPILAEEFIRAVAFWATVVDLSWHEEPSSACAIQLVDGTPAILKDATVARSQFTEWNNFQGWIAFDPKAPLTRPEMYLTAVHEIGHLLGLKHNPNPNSVMYYLDLRGREWLDVSDLSALAARHRLLIAQVDKPIRIRRPSNVSLSNRRSDF
jgi:Matrixin